MHLTWKPTATDFSFNSCTLQFKTVLSYLPKNMSILRFNLHLVMKSCWKSLLFSSKYEVRSQALLAEFQIRILQVINKQPEFPQKVTWLKPKLLCFHEEGSTSGYGISNVPCSVKTKLFHQGKIIFSPMAQNNNNKKKLYSRYKRRGHCKILSPSVLIY